MRKRGLLVEVSGQALASAMQALSERTLRTIDGAIDHYFEKRSEGVVTPRDLFVLTHWLLSGIAAM